MSNVFWDPQQSFQDQLTASLRRQFNWRRRWETVLKDSDLPAEIQSLIFNVVNPTRMMRFEKAEVTEDLIAHFEDGSRNGRAYSELAADFGDPQIVSELIESSKTRSRPVLVKMLRAGVAGGVGIVGLYVALLAFFHSQSPNPSVDYLADFNANVIETPEELRAWPIYRESWAKHEFSEGLGGRFEEIYHENEDGSQRLIRPTDPGWKAALAKLDDAQDLLLAFREGAKLPYLGIALEVDPNNYSPEDFRGLYPNREQNDVHDYSFGAEASDKANELLNDSLIGILLPHVQSFRKAARIFRVDSRRAIEEGDSDRVVENVEVMFGMANQVAESHCLVNALVAMAITQLGYEQIEETLREHPEFLTIAQLERLQKAVREIQPSQFVDFSGERVFIKDMIQRVYSDDGNGNGRLTPEGLEILNMVSEFGGNMFEGEEDFWSKSITRARVALGPLTLFTAASRKEMLEKSESVYDLIDENFDKPYWSGALDAVKAQVETGREKYGVLMTLFPAVKNVKLSVVRVEALNAGTDLGLTIHLYKMETGEWPASIEELRPEWIQEMPMDPLTGNDLKVDFAESGPIIYGFGPDGDDDQGKPTLDSQGKPTLSDPLSAKPTDGDWVLWPKSFAD